MLIKNNSIQIIKLIIKTPFCIFYKDRIEGRLQKKGKIN